MPWTEETAPSSTWTGTANPTFADASLWTPADPDEHILVTVAIEDLLVNLEDISEDPEDVQCCKDAWTVES